MKKETLDFLNPLFTSLYHCIHNTLFLDLNKGIIGRFSIGPKNRPIRGVPVLTSILRGSWCLGGIWMVEFNIIGVLLNCLRIWQDFINVVQKC